MEYMDYNRDDETITRGKKIRSRIIVVVSSVWIIFFLGWAIFRSPQTIRTAFPTQTSPSHSFSEKQDRTENEFLVFNDALMKSTLVQDIDFAKKYPYIAELLTLDDDQISSAKPILYDRGGYLCLTMLYRPNIDQRLRIMDVIAIPYQSDEKTLSVSLGIPERFSVEYDKTKYTIKTKAISKKLFHLNFYKLAVNVTTKGTIRSVDATINLNSPLLKRDVKESVYNTILNLNNDKKADNTFTAAISDTVLNKRYAAESLNGSSYKMTVNFNDFVYRKVDKITVSSAASLTENASFSITVN
ncbi:MAG: hypothetical protein BGN88_11060 [Clostridiales bacterium 43-6]|nr:MAG: hypothetical protein BGN88_11060 [Clostridiales bacterium 43-6]